MSISTAKHWTCPYCNRDATVSGDNISSGLPTFFDNNKYGELGLLWRSTTCPNPQCRETELSIGLYKIKRIQGTSGPRIDGTALQAWRRPASSAKVYPAYIPVPILADYAEACLICDLSPKASATLSRRCLQGMIRDFWGITEARLIDEIDALEDKVDADTWAAIDSVRNIGNIGAHMEKDINVIVDVGQDEAQLLIGLIETLLKEWYITRHDRKERMSKIVSTATAKKPNAVRKLAKSDDEDTASS